MRPVIIIQARMGSTRLPGKVLESLAGHPMLWHIVERARSARGVQEVVVATSDLASDDPIREFCDTEGIAVFSGSEDDVLDRYYQAAVAHDADPVLRVTGDCPLLEPDVIERVLDTYVQGQSDYVGAAIGSGAQARGVNGYPDGLDVECFGFAALERAWSDADDPDEREHVTPYIWRRPDEFACMSVGPDEDLSGLRLTVDYPEDLVIVTAVYDALFQEGSVFHLDDVLDFLVAHQDLQDANREFIGQEKYRHLWNDLKASEDTKEADS